MTLQLVPTLGGMSALLPRLHADQDVQIAVVQTVSLAESCVAKYKSIMTSEGGRIITEKDLLVSSSCPNDVRVQKLMTSIKNATSSIVAIRDDAIRIQSSVHDNYEMCRERTQSHKRTIDGDTVKMETLAKQISDTNSQISSCQSQSESFDNDAGKLDARAGDIESAARKKNDAGILGAVLGGVGILLAPFTAGISLTLTAAGVATATVNLNDAESCRNTASNLRSSAEQRRKDAENLRTRKAGLETEKSEAELEIIVIKSKIDQLEKASTSLHTMTSELSTFVLAIDNTLNVFQRMETCFKETLLQTESFTIIQNAFARQPERAAGKANKYLTDLKARWETLEGLLLQSGASRPLAVHQ